MGGRIRHRRPPVVHHTSSRASSSKLLMLTIPATKSLRGLNVHGTSTTRWHLSGSSSYHKHVGGRRRRVWRGGLGKGQRSLGHINGPVTGHKRRHLVGCWLETLTGTRKWNELLHKTICPFLKPASRHRAPVPSLSATLQASPSLPRGMNGIATT